MTKKVYDIAAYIWPAYHYEPRLEHLWPEKDGEWYTVRRGTPRFAGHDMPRVPLLGYQDEADPAVMRQQVALGAAHGVNTFIVDWYWYEGQPCFERQLNDALIPALEQSDSKFYLMWANHDADTLWDMHTDERRPLWDGKVSREVFEPMMERIIDKYFGLKSYYKIDGCPVFSLFLAGNFTVGMGGVVAARDAIDWLRRRVREKGFPGIHLQTMVWRNNNASPEASAKLEGMSNAQIAAALGVDSATNYTFTSSAQCWDGDYVQIGCKAIARWPEDRAAYPMYFPHVSIGWDNTQRDPVLAKAVVNSTPFAFEAFLLRAKEEIDTQAKPGQPPLITINSWNEWTEGSYLLPDMRWGYGYLQAVKRVFCSQEYG